MTAPRQADRGSRLPPQSLDAERCTLGSMLRDNATIPEVVEVARPADFYLDAHQKVAAAIYRLYDARRPADLVTLADALKAAGHVDDVGGYGYLAELWDASPTAANAVYYAGIVRDKSTVRRLIHAGNEILRAAYDQAGPAAEMLEQAERLILDLSTLGAAGQATHVSEVLRECFARIDKAAVGGEVESGIPTGLVELDDLTGGLHDSELIVIAARPSVGKTGLALQFAAHAAARRGVPTLFASLEMRNLELGNRLLAARGSVNGRRIRQAHLLRDDELGRIRDAGEALSGAGLWFDDAPGQTVGRIAANARRMKQRNKLGLLVVDYLQLIESESRRENRQEVVAGISRRLKLLARELNIPVVALSQLNRDSENRPDRKPKLSDIRESGAVEQDSDEVLLLWRPDAGGQQEGAPPPEIERVDVVVAKQRNGPVGDVRTVFRRSFMRFEDYAGDDRGDSYA